MRAGYDVLDMIGECAFEKAQDARIGAVSAFGERIDRLSFYLINRAGSDMLEKGEEARRNYLTSRHRLIEVSVVSMSIALAFR